MAGAATLSASSDFLPTMSLINILIEEGALVAPDADRGPTLVGVTRVQTGEGRATLLVGMTANTVSASGGSAAGEVDALDRVDRELY